MITRQARRIHQAEPTYRLDLLPTLCRAVLDGPRPPVPTRVPPPKRTWWFCCVCGLWRLVGVSNRSRRWACSHGCRARLIVLRAAEARGPCVMRPHTGCPGFRRRQWVSCSRTCAVAYRTWLRRERRKRRWLERECLVCAALIRRKCHPTRLPLVCSPACRGEWQRWGWLEDTVADIRRKVATLSPMEAFKFGTEVARARLRVSVRRQQRQALAPRDRDAVNARRRVLRRLRHAGRPGLDGPATGPGRPREQWTPDPVAARGGVERPRGDDDTAPGRACAGRGAVFSADPGDEAPGPGQAHQGDSGRPDGHRLAR